MGEILDSFQTYDKEHGRLETRCLKASTALNAYLADWPGLAQVIEYRQQGYLVLRIFRFSI